MSQKEKFALYLTPEMKARLERRYTEDGSRSLTGFIENAINFYLDYLSANNAGMFLPASVQSYLDGRLDQLENRMSSLLYKQAVTLDTGMSVLVDCVHLDETYLRKKRAESAARVKKLNGHLQLEKMAKRGMDPEDIKDYLMIFKYGMPPHGGLGIGLERLTMRLLDEQNVRETSLFPRDVTRLEP